MSHAENGNMNVHMRTRMLNPAHSFQISIIIELNRSFQIVKIRCIECSAMEIVRSHIICIQALMEFCRHPPKLVLLILRLMLILMNSGINYFLTII